MAALVADELQALLARLDDEMQRAVALLKIEGFSNPEIAEKLGRPLRTIERKLALIRKIWKGSEQP